MRLKSIVLAAAVLVFASLPASAKIIHVPSDSSTIQDGINGTVNGDTVLVAPGIYYENIDFKGKAIMVCSKFIFTRNFAHVESTIISGGGSGSVVSFNSGETDQSTISGLTIRDGGSWHGAGILCSNYASPTIKHNLIVENTIGGTRESVPSSSKSGRQDSEHKTVSYSRLSPHGGAGIICGDRSAAKILNNIIKDNYSGDYTGGGIRIAAQSYPQIKNNVIVNNAATRGGGIYCTECDTPLPTIVNNIIVDNTGSGITCGGCIPVVAYNDVWNNSQSNFDGCDIFGDTTWGTNFNGTACDSFYNIMGDPLFSDTTDYALLCSSVCIDAGDPSLEVPDGGGRRIDIGAYEYPYIIGDANQDGEINIIDIVYIVNCLWRGGPCPCPMGKGDVNCKGFVNVVDLVYLINYLFKGGPPPCEPEKK